MRAIFTKYIGYTQHKPSRISASDSQGNRVVISVPIEYNSESEQAHRVAAELLAKRMKWIGPNYGPLIAGGYSKGYIFVFSPELGTAHEVLELAQYETMHFGALTPRCKERIAETIRQIGKGQ